jgi:NodT family efflux transporter outer membrane factor (OMF) lipoprotein
MRVSDLGNNSAFLKAGRINKSVSLATKEPFFKLGQWPQSQWWQALHSNELNKLIQEALINNPSIQSVEQKVQIAKEIANKAKAPLFPGLFFGGNDQWGGLSRNSIPYQYNPSLGSIYDVVDLSLSFEYTFDFWGKYRNQLKSARGETRSQEAELKQVELLVSTSLAKVYYALKTNIARKKLYQDLYLVKNNMLALNDLLYEKAINTRIQPATSVEDLGDIQKEILALDEEIANNVHLLNVLRGTNPDSVISLSQPLGDVPNELKLPKNLNSDLIIRRPDLVAAIWHIESLAYEVNIAVADFFPRINLMGFLGLGSIGWKNLFDWRSGMAKLEPSIHLPIFRAGEIRANARKSRAQLQSSIYNYNDLLLKSLQDVSDSLVSVTRSYKQKEVQFEILREAELKLSLLQMKYQSGIDGLLAVYQVQVELLERRLQDVMITYQQYISVIQVIKSLGGGYCAEDLKWFQKGDGHERRDPKS